MNEHSPEFPSTSGPCLEIRGGRTRSPFRPLTGDRFLIGAGTNCHLQLGGEIPLAHTVLTCDHGEWMAEALNSQPALMINRQAVRKGLLRDGDELAIGPFTMIAHLPMAEESEEDLLAPLDLDALATELAQEKSLPETLAELSAEALVDGLTRELVQHLDGDASNVSEAAVDLLVEEIMAQLARESHSTRILPMESGTPAQDDSLPLRRSA